MLANTIKALGAIALLTFPFSILATRLDLIHFRTAFDLIGNSVMLAVAIFLVGTIVGFLASKSYPELAKAARFASLLSVVPLIVLGNQFIKTQTLPAIHNISTDVQNPPSFNAIASVRGPDANPLEYPATNIAPQQAAYPNVKTLILEQPVSEVFARAMSVVEENGWEIVAQDADAGIIEATATTLLWGFKDDVVIRVTEGESSTLVDVRSVSRVGASDIGANAKRIESILSDLAN